MHVPLYKFPLLLKLSPEPGRSKLNLSGKNEGENLGKVGVDEDLAQISPSRHFNEGLGFLASFSVLNIQQLPAIDYTH